MSAFLQDYWPLLVVVQVALLTVWGIGLIEWRAGYTAGRCDALREIEKARRANRL